MSKPELLLCGRKGYKGPNGEGPCSDGDLIEESTNIIERSAILQNANELEDLQCPLGYNIADTPIAAGENVLWNINNKKGLFEINRMGKNLTAYQEQKENPRRHRVMVACERAKFEPSNINDFVDCCDSKYQTKTDKITLSQTDKRTINLDNKERCSKNGKPWDTNHPSCKTVIDKTKERCSNARYFGWQVCTYWWNNPFFPERRAEGEKFRTAHCDKWPESENAYCVNNRSKKMPYTYVFGWNSLPDSVNAIVGSKHPVHPGAAAGFTNKPMTSNLSLNSTSNIEYFTNDISINSFENPINMGEY